MCGQTMFKKSGRGFNKPFCINPECSNFLPEDKRGYQKKTDTAEKKTAAAGKKTSGSKTGKTAKTTTKTTTKTTAKKTKKTAEKE